MDGMFRRGAIYYARLAVPRRLRRTVGKTELIASTGHHDFSSAKVVASGLMAGWRRQLADIDGLSTNPMDIEQLVAGHPALSGGGYLPLRLAGEASGLDEHSLFAAVADGRLGLFLRCGGLPGCKLQEQELEVNHGPHADEVIVPSAAQMPHSANHPYYGLLRLRQHQAIASALIANETPTVVLFDIPDQPGWCFAPETPVVVKSAGLEVSALQVESLRRGYASKVTPLQIEVARAKPAAAPSQSTLDQDAPTRASEAVERYMRVRALTCNDDQARRVRAALMLFVELEGDPKLADITARRMEVFRDDKLPMVPANENKLRLQYGTKTVTESITAISSAEWPRISPREQAKRLAWIAAMFAWLRKKNWIAQDPCGALLEESAACASVKRNKDRTQEARAIFSPEDLKRIFTTGTWFQTGRGELTKSGTYRAFVPHYYWLPLLGLFTGARINEVAQLHLADIKCTPSGTWFCELAELNDEEGKKRRKNANSKRTVPLHPFLISLGLIEWRNALEAAGYRRLFPELKHDKVKGYGKAPTKWFSGYLKRLGWERDGRKVFHSFRGTLASQCVNRLKLTNQETAQISGHARESGALAEHYVKDELPDFLAPTVARLNFGLPTIFPFDCTAGLAAVAHALARKGGGRGAHED
ncbi:site-specific integrase [Paucibacter soli]|uniref:site-specific integrase n=1 Tax=Paucibacter soli TaxID=3133433 RepID=UPI00309F348B